MKNHLLVIIILNVILNTSCNLRQKPDFESIDFSINRDRSQKSFSLKVFQSGESYIHFQQNIYIHTDKENNYAFNLNNNDIDTISLLTKSVINSNLDSVYYTDCLSCMNFHLILKTKQGKYKFFHLGDLNSNSKFKILEDYVKYLNRLIDRSMSSIDSSLKFESWTNRLLPPPPPR